MDRGQKPNFGERLRRYRLAAGLTQQALAERAGISIRSISDMECGVRRTPRHDTIHLLSTALVLSDDERAAFVAAAIDPHGITAASGPRDHPPHNLPAPSTPLIGREQEVAALRAYLGNPDVRLVTLTGPAGVGKTRLGLHVALDLVDDFADGVYFMPLAAVRDPRMVIPAIALPLGLKEGGDGPLLQRVTESLRPKRVLLVLDNFEQVVEAAPVVAELLASGGQVKVLVTSRAVLHVRGEHEFAVPPLALPAPRRLLDAAAVGQYPAVALFIQRARAVKPGFKLTNALAPAVAEICARVDGLPLGIELAAARIKVLSPQALLGRLDRRLQLLTGGARDLPERHQTLRGAIDWSYDLLDAGEQALFARLGVFVAGCTLEAAEAVCNAAGDLPGGALAGFAILVDTSLLRQEDVGAVTAAGEEPRFAMLETLREYALERLATSGEEDRVRRVHAAYYLALVERAEQYLTGPEQATWFAFLEQEHDNLRAALRYVLNTGETAAGLGMAGVLWRLWTSHGQLSEGRAWLEQLLAASPSTPVPAAVRAKALIGAGAVAYVQGDYRHASTRYEEGLALYRELADKRGISRALTNLGNAALILGDYRRAIVLFEESLAVARELGNKEVMAFALTSLGTVAHDHGDASLALVLHEESLALRRELGDQGGIGLALRQLGTAVRDHGDYARATTLHQEGLSLYRELGHKQGTALALQELGAVARGQGHYPRAIELFEESLAVFRDQGSAWSIAWLHHDLGSVARDRGEQPRAIQLFEESLTLFQEQENRWGIAFVLTSLGMVARDQGDYPRAKALLEESLAVARELGLQWAIATALTMLAGVALGQDDVERAAAVYQESLALHERLGDKIGVAEDLEGMAAVGCRNGEFTHAVRLDAAATALRATLGAPLTPVARARHDEAVATTRQALGKTAFAAAWAEGGALSMEQVITYLWRWTADGTHAIDEIPPIPLGVRLRAARRDRGLSLAAVGAMFGVSHATVSKWEAGPASHGDGKVHRQDVPRELIPLVQRWIAGGEPPTTEEIGARITARSGVNAGTGKPWKGVNPSREA